MQAATSALSKHQPDPNNNCFSTRTLSKLIGRSSFLLCVIFWKETTAHSLLHLFKYLWNLGTTLKLLSHWVSAIITSSLLLQRYWVSPTRPICPEPTFTSISVAGIHLKWSLVAVITQALQHQKADSLTIEHAEPWNHSQAQLLVFHDWHYLEWALLKEGCCFLWGFFPYKNAYFSNSITERVKSSFKVRRFTSKSYLFYFKAF